jgi:molecular chaperone DnaK
MNSTLIESIGIETLGGVFTPLLTSGVSVPCQKSEVFSTAADNQDQIMIMLFRGNAQMAKDNKRIGHFQIQGIPPARRGIPKIQVSFIVTKSDIMLDARDLSTGRKMKIVKIANDPQQGGGEERR